jgi:hypothetical protein
MTDRAALVLRKMTSVASASAHLRLAQDAGVEGDTHEDQR